LTSIAEVQTELRRVVDRLSSMPLAKAETCIDAAHETAVLILDQTRLIDASIPEDVRLPRVGVSASAAQLAVIGEDYLAAVRRSPQTDTSPVLDELVRLRRSLP
jgi:hypothetical protein